LTRADEKLRQSEASLATRSDGRATDVAVDYSLVLPDDTTRHVLAVGHPADTPSASPSWSISRVRLLFTKSNPQREVVDVNDVVPPHQSPAIIETNDAAGRGADGLHHR
jgi:hypothetical protein